MSGSSRTQLSGAGVPVCAVAGLAVGQIPQQTAQVDTGAQPMWCCAECALGVVARAAEAAERAEPLVCRSGVAT